MRRLVSLAAPLAVGLVVAGCAVPTPPPSGQMGPERHELSVERLRYRHTVDFPGQGARLDEGSRSALIGFLRDSGVGPDTEIRVAAASGADRQLGDRRRRRVLAFLEGLGVEARAADPLGAVNSDPEADVLVQVTRYHVVLPDCPDHTRTRMGDFHNLNTSNHGCATARNLGVMVANPRDLKRGRELAPAEAPINTLAIRKYRRGEAGADDASTSLQITSEGSEGRQE